MHQQKKQKAQRAISEELNSTSEGGIASAAAAPLAFQTSDEKETETTKPASKLTQKGKVVPTRSKPKRDRATVAAGVDAEYELMRSLLLRATRCGAWDWDARQRSEQHCLSAESTPVKHA
jgi:hypothetical protein